MRCKDNGLQGVVVPPLVFHSLDVKAKGGRDGRDIFSEELFDYRRFSSIVQTTTQTHTVKEKTLSLTIVEVW